MANTEEKLAAWARKHDLKHLHKALREYDYKTRLSAVEHLGKIKNRDSIPYLEKLIDDSFLQVLQAAHDSFKTISPSHPSLSEFRKRIEKMVKMEESRKQRTKQNFAPLSEEEERKKLKEAAQRVRVAKIYQKGLNEQQRKINHWKWVVTILLIVALLITLSRLLYWA